MRPPIICIFFFLYLLHLSFNFNVAGAGDSSGKTAGGNPFTPKAYLIRYWKKEVSCDLPKPWFLLNKASPMSAEESARFSKLADQNALSSQLSSFCTAANLLCPPDLSPSLEKHDPNANFAMYSNKNFSNYGTDRLVGVDSFKNYSDGENVVEGSFQGYSRHSTAHKERFSNYAPDSNFVDRMTFNTYAAAATGGAGEFTGYNQGSNLPNLQFTSYSADGNAHSQSFTTYTETANAGVESFASYGKNENAAQNEFRSYGEHSNVMGSSFNGYGESANAATDTFTSYGSDGNIPANRFKNYGEGGNRPIETFKNYRDLANIGDDSFQSYGKKSNAARLNFLNYGQYTTAGTESFAGYGEGASGQAVAFKIYGAANNFTDYANKKAVSFASYTNRSSAELTSMAATGNGKVVNRWVEPGKFFREKMLKPGTVMSMPDIRDKMRKRSFLPRSIWSKLPFSTSKLAELKRIFHAGEGSTMEKILSEALSECERAPSRGETKRCVGSAEDMIDFAVSVLGRNVMVRTTANTEGSRKDVMIGSVKGINGGKLTKSVSCHQSLFPNLLYYCHSVPQVRVYEADLLDPKSKSKINHGVAICHVDTSAWSPGHGAFVALGSGPGKIEVCHWIFENDMTWTTAD
ncbi:polygalacturonase-1 non-catalytic subunit beta-like isoform X4 [Diospyros lotus]|uniref:polygalacturonase-1 non-catalytic subunit beta-like isoform X4 n=1 Tax=Diospyros lotus TaxID=55363 RepID=UPI00225AA58C|nr:polygalacturonase-1 non-catalytic subunit beta-like isoform X4 [Diospyros lotus]